MSNILDQSLDQQRNTFDIESRGSSNLTRGTGGAWGTWWKDKRKNNDKYLIAAEKGDLEQLKKLLSEKEMKDLKADINTKGLDNWTALHYGAEGGFVEIIQELISQKADVTLKSSLKRTALHNAARFGHM